MAANDLPAGSRVGCVAFRVGDLEGTAAFYESAIGLERLDAEAGPRTPTGSDAAPPSDDVAVLGAGGDPLLVLLDRPDAGPRERTEAGLYHAAIRVPDRTALGAALERIRSDARLAGAADHGVSEALYLADPEGNGLEVYCDRPRSTWTVEGDRVQFDSAPLDLQALLAESDGAERVPDATDVGHVHLEVTDLAAARACYVDALGTGVRATLPDALFVAAGEYHHHVGLNTWRGRSEPAGEGFGLAWFEVVVPDDAALTAATERLVDGGFDAAHEESTDGRRTGAATVRDPDGIALRLRSED